MAVAVAAQGLFADLEPVPAAVAVAPAQLALQQLPIADHLLQAAHAAVEFLVVGVENFLPQTLAQLAHLGLAVAQLRAEVVVAEHHPLAGDVVHVQGVGNGLDHIRPEVFPLDQRQLDAFAGGDIADAEGDGVVVLDQLRQLHHQPQVAHMALGGVDLDFGLQLTLAAEGAADQLLTNPAVAQWSMANQQLPGLLGRGDAEQALGHAVDFTHPQAL